MNYNILCYKSLHIKTIYFWSLTGFESVVMNMNTESIHFQIFITQQCISERVKSLHETKLLKHTHSNFFPFVTKQMFFEIFSKIRIPWMKLHFPFYTSNSISMCNRKSHLMPNPCYYNNTNTLNLNSNYFSRWNSRL